MYNKVVLSVLQKVLHVQGKQITGMTNFRSLGASQDELNWVLLETEQRLDVQLPVAPLTQDSTIKDLIKSVVSHRT